MKKSLLLISLSLCFIYSSCQNSGRKTKTVEVKPSPKEKALASDTTKVTGQTSSSGTAGGDKGIAKDSSRKPTDVKAIKHNDPEQAKIDSIKKAKSKEKYKK